MIQRVAGRLRGSWVGKIPGVKQTYLTLNRLTTKNNYLKRLDLYDFSIYVDLRDTGDLTSTLVAKGEYDTVMSKAISDIIRPESACIDIGANIGYFTLMMASYKAKKVWAYEPELKNFELLKRNIALNNYSGVFPVLGAISNIEGRAWLQTNKNYQGAHYLASWGDELVDVTSLDSLKSAKQIDFIKVDTQGSEARILDGMREVLRVNAHLDMIWAYLPQALRRGGSDPADFLVKLSLLGPMSDLDEGSHKVVTGITPEQLYKKYPDGKHTNILVRR
jgi:FkbM family methyltransferase